MAKAGAGKARKKATGGKGRGGREDLELKGEKAQRVKGGAVDAFLKYGPTTFAK